jgi:hypothetical protein
MEKKQLPDEFKEFIQLLNSAKVRYVVLGGWAVNLYSNPRVTGDIDFLVGIDDKNIKRLLQALEKFGLKNVPEKYLKEKGNVVRMGRPPTKIEILTSASGIDFEKCYKKKKKVKLNDVTVNFISKEDLMVNKKAAGRSKDIADFDALS